jgi:soluble lytic murein transglycosylase-like protein
MERTQTMTAVFELLRQVLIAMELSAAIAAADPSIAISKPAQDSTRLTYSIFIVQAAEANKLDPYLVAAVMWHESDFRNLPKNATDDYGLMQVHWQRLNPKYGEDWLVGLTRQDLMDPRINVFAGARELAHYKRFCTASGHQHHWWVHYLSGPDKLGPTPYGRKVNWRYKKLIRSRPKPVS